MSTAELKLQIANQINSFDDEKLEQFYAVLIQLLSKNTNQNMLKPI